MDENYSVGQVGDPPMAKRSRFRFVRFRREKSGAVAVEFAFLGPIFLAVLYGIIETGVIFLQITAMDAGVDEAKRLVMTGKIGAAGNVEQQKALFRTGFCRGADWIVRCEDVAFDVRAFDNFSSVMIPSSPISGGAFNMSNTQFQPGRANQIVIIRAYYVTSAVTAWIRQDFANTNDGKTVLVGSAAIKNEP